MLPLKKPWEDRVTFSINKLARDKWKFTRNSPVAGSSWCLVGVVWSIYCNQWLQGWGRYCRPLQLHGDSRANNCTNGRSWPKGRRSLSIASLPAIPIRVATARTAYDGSWVTDDDIAWLCKNDNKEKEPDWDDALLLSAHPGHHGCAWPPSGQ